jgi:hypothetical protein
MIVYDRHIHRVRDMALTLAEEEKVQVHKQIKLTVSIGYSYPCMAVIYLLCHGMN